MATKKTKKPDMKSLAKKGGAATLEKYGKSHYSRMIKKRWANVKKAKKAAATT